MAWTCFVIWFLCFSVCEGSRLVHPEHVMHGEVQSPEYPMPYPPNVMRQWDLWVPEGYQIQLTLTHLDIKTSEGCYQDSLTVLYNQSVLGRFCGQERSSVHPSKEPILSPGNRLTLIFQTSNSTSELQHHIGFSATHKATDIDECLKPDPGDGSGPLCSQLCVNTLGSYHCSCYSGYKLHLDQRTCLLSCSNCILDKHEGHLSSPGYPRPSPPLLSCKYIISVEPGFTVTLNFTNDFHIDSVDTQQEPSCPHHWLQVTIPDRLPMKLCGAKSPALIATNSNTVRLDYHTDEKGLSNGWSLEYSTDKVKCPYPGNVANGRVTPILTQYFYRDHIHVTCDQEYRLMTNCREIKTFSATCQSNGQWDLPMPECHSILIDCGEPEPLLNGGVTFLSGFQTQYCSVIQYHCNEPFYSLLGGINATFTCEADGKWKSNHDSAVTLTCLPVCGQPTKLISGYERVIGGSDAPENTIPWQVLLNREGGRGGGMIIADRWIMTAAHIGTNNGEPISANSVRIYMGLNKVKPKLDPPVYPASIHVHPEYNNRNYNNDIALIKLQDPITFHSSVMPICLPAEGATYHTGTMGLVSGFTSIKQEGRMLLKDQLSYVHIPLVDQEICNNSVTFVKKTHDDLQTLTNNMFCAGFHEGGKDSCQGDGGSPFVLRDNGQFWAAGIVSWGFECGRQGKYGVYTKVINYLNWINKTMEEN